MEVIKHQHIELIQAAQNGDTKAEFQLYQLYVKAMFNTALRLLNNQQDAEDVLQEAFVAAFRNLRNYRFDSSFGSWLKKIVINKGINLINKRKVELGHQDVDELNIELEDDEVSDVEYSVETIKKAMQELPDGYRVILSLYLFEGYDHNEIGEILSIATSTSKSQFHRAKKKLKNILLSIYEA